MGNPSPDLAPADWRLQLREEKDHHSGNGARDQKLPVDAPAGFRRRPVHPDPNHRGRDPNHYEDDDTVEKLIDNVGPTQPVGRGEKDVGEYQSQRKNEPVLRRQGNTS